MIFHWPWVSRLAYEQVASERDRLRAQNDALIEHLKRIDRAEHGMPELPRQPRAAQEKMPIELLNHFKGYANQDMAKRFRDEAYERHLKHGEPWDVIAHDYMDEDDDG